MPTMPDIPVKIEVDELSPVAPGDAFQPVDYPARKHYVGFVDGVTDYGTIEGWAWDEYAPTQSVQVAMQVDGARTAILTAHNFRADLVMAGIEHGCYGFSWRIPPAFLDGQPHDIRVFNLGVEEELPGSPLIFNFGAKENESSKEPPLFVNHDYNLWPSGLSGAIAGRQIELAPGVFVDFEGDKGGVYSVIKPQFASQQELPYYGVRLTNRATGACWLYHQLAGSASKAVTDGVMLGVELSLGSAPEPLSQRTAVVFLAQRTEKGFERLRRLVKGRAFRQSTLLAFYLKLSQAELKALKDRMLFLAFSLENCTVLEIHPAQLLKKSHVSPRGLVGFEDRRLVESFDACWALAKASGRGDEYARVLRPEPSPSSGSDDGVVADANHAFRVDADSPGMSTSDDTVLGPAALLERRESTTGLVSNQWDCLHAQIAGRMQYPFTQIIVPAFNGGSIVTDCLRSISKNTKTPFQCLVLNDGSSGYTAEMLREFISSDPRFVIYDRAANRGYTKSINEAVKLTAADWLVILNSDTLVPDDWLARLHDATAAYSDVGMVGPLSNAASYQSLPRLRERDGSWCTNDFIKPRNLDAVQAILARHSECAYPTVPLLNGFCTLISRKVFVRCGVFDEEAFPIGYGEENDLCLRAGKGGFRLVVADDCFVYHRKSVTFGTKEKNALSKAGNCELLNKHVGISVSDLERRMQENPILTRLRERMMNLRFEIG